MRCVGTFIFGRPRPLTAHRRAEHPYTLVCEEPVSHQDPAAPSQGHMADLRRHGGVT